jgi:dehydrogenase/reductase SDR family member 12
MPEELQQCAPVRANGNTPEMARYTTTIRTALAPAEAFAYMADFSNARFWDPSVSQAQREDDGPVGLGSAFSLVARFAGRNVPLTYTIVAFEPPVRVVLEARRGFVSRDTIDVEAVAAGGSAVHYDALLSFSGIGRLFDPLMQRIFDRVGARAAAGIEEALNATRTAGTDSPGR